MSADNETERVKHARRARLGGRACPPSPAQRPRKTCISLAEERVDAVKTLKNGI